MVHEDVDEAPLPRSKKGRDSKVAAQGNTQSREHFVLLKASDTLQIAQLVEKMAAIVCQGLEDANRALKVTNSSHLLKIQALIGSFGDKVVLPAIARVSTKKRGQELATSVVAAASVMFYQVLVENHDTIFPPEHPARSINKNVAATSVILWGFERMPPVIPHVDLENEFLRALHQSDFGGPELHELLVRSGSSSKGLLSASIRAENTGVIPAVNPPTRAPEKEGSLARQWTVDVIKAHILPQSTSSFGTCESSGA